MTTYRTMTVGGLYGSEIEADTDDEAEALAEAKGYEVLDVIDRQGERGGTEWVLVVADDATPDPEDWTMHDVTGGVSVGNGITGHWATFPDREAAEVALREHMNEESYWPDVWWVSDHGNTHLVSDQFSAGRRWEGR